MPTGGRIRTEIWKPSRQTMKEQGSIFGSMSCFLRGSISFENPISCLMLQKNVGCYLQSHARGLRTNLCTEKKDGHTSERPVASLSVGQNPCWKLYQTSQKLYVSILETKAQILETILGNLSRSTLSDVIRQAGTQHMLPPATLPHSLAPHKHSTPKNKE